MAFGALGACDNNVQKGASNKILQPTWHAGGFLHQQFSNLFEQS